MEKDLRQVSSQIFRVVLYGPESTGKTTLAQALANHFQTEWVQEFARDYLQKKWEEQLAVCTLEDLPVIVAGQLEWENQKVIKANQILICDTNVLVTRVWSETHFNGYLNTMVRLPVLTIRCFAYRRQLSANTFFSTNAPCCLISSTP